MQTQSIDKGTVDYPEWILKQMHRLPDHLYYSGHTQLAALLERPRVAVVGSRQMSPYGRQVTAKLVGDLAARGVLIISGLALGVDAVAHRAALQAGGLTLAILPTPLDNIRPAANRGLAKDILDNNGGLLTNYAPGSDSHKNNFVARNELVAALCEVLVITEAAPGSGSLRTAAFADNMQCTIMAVPGSIFSPTSAGTNMLLHAGTAEALTSYTDVLTNLRVIDSVRQVALPVSHDPLEQAILAILVEGISDGTAILERSKLSVPEFNRTLSMLEITGKIKSLGANQWGIP